MIFKRKTPFFTTADISQNAIIPIFKQEFEGERRKRRVRLIFNNKPIYFSGFVYKDAFKIKPASEFRSGPTNMCDVKIEEIESKKIKITFQFRTNYFQNFYSVVFTFMALYMCITALTHKLSAGSMFFTLILISLFVLVSFLFKRELNRNNIRLKQYIKLLFIELKKSKQITTFEFHNSNKCNE